ncbi:hypothetical protein JKF63_00203 [Porcisia hertigi]|uniref:UDENN domain-containing protein n=1 Tax=Porcisia hertigi TaxID=2761500 RepID=A0A836KWX6_9TRYP|nr:hypothetical protein JKF63_00203 [Porcisia hertigi]
MGSLSLWVDCFVSIRFDLDLGPKIESISPPDAITEEGKIKLLQCAFPDCNPDCGYNFIFYFTIPDCTTAAAQRFSQTVAPPATGNTVPELYGAAFYRQKHDPNVPRHYVQQVVVLLSHLPYYNVHDVILRVVAPRFCQCCSLSPDTGKVPIFSLLTPVPETYLEVAHSYSAEHYTQEDVLRDAMMELAQWPSPHPQVRYTVTLLQQTLVFVTPARSHRQLNRATRSSCASVRSAMSVDYRAEFMEAARGSARFRGSTLGSDFVPLFKLLGHQLHHLTYVWELLIRHEPLLILSNTPCMASAAAFSIASLVLPIEFNGILRSYFTVQNEDFPRLSRMGKALSFPSNCGLIVAGTNPFLLRSFSGWPSLLVVMDNNTSDMVNGSVASPASSREGFGAHMTSEAISTPPHPSLSHQQQQQQQQPNAHTSASVASHLPASAMTDELCAETPPLPFSRDTHTRTTSGCASFFLSMKSLTSPTSQTSELTNSLHHTGLRTSVMVMQPSLSSSSSTDGASFPVDAMSQKSVVFSAASYTADLHDKDNAEPPRSPSSSAPCLSRNLVRGGAVHWLQRAAAGVPAEVQVSTNARGALSTQLRSGVDSSPERTSHGRGRALPDGSDASVESAPYSPVAPVTLSSPVVSPATLFTTDHYKTAVESVRSAENQKRGGAHQENLRSSLQQRLRNHFDSSVEFLLSHAEQTQMLLERLQMVSLLDADAQRTSVSLSLAQWHGNLRRTPLSAAGVNASCCASSLPPPSSVSTGDCSSHHYPDPTASGVTSCSYFTVADDMVRRFFTSLTSDFLTPVTTWFHRVTAPYTFFHLCDCDLCDTLLTPSAFLKDFAQHHRTTAPYMWTRRHSYKTYKVVYERFANGCLFKAYVRQLVNGSLRQAIEDFQVENWVTRVPSNAERIDLFISLYNTVQRELNETLDPDALFVTSATTVLASMAVVLQQPHREQFMLKIGELKL